jgi:3-deoxy-manno-octulosonate cytidylyltransferase (CMP-KDO synthetase)
MKVVAVIPARFAATRFHAKLMQPLGDYTVLQHTYLNTVATNLFNEVWVVADSEIIAESIKAIKGKVILSKKEHESGTDRIAEAMHDIDVDIIINVQGDEPFVQKEPLEKLIKVFKEDHNRLVSVASVMQIINDDATINNPNAVKVCVDKNNNALFFSRSPIPYKRDTQANTIYYKHIGIYAFRKEALIQFTNWPQTPLEISERIECLRYLENGLTLKMVLTNTMGIGIDTPEDLEKAKKHLGIN